MGHRGAIAASRRRGVTVTSFASSKTPRTTKTLACADAETWTYYHDGVGSFPADGDTIYTDDPGTIKLNGGGNWLAWNTDRAAQVSSSGVVSSEQLC